MSEGGRQDQIDNLFDLQDHNDQQSFSKCPRNREPFRTLDRIWLTAITSIRSFRIAVLPGDGIGVYSIHHRGFFGQHLTRSFVLTMQDPK